MIEVKEEYPFIDYNGKAQVGLIRHWAEDENGVHYVLKQVETELEYDEAIDVYPCRYTYVATDKIVGDESEEKEE